MHFKKILKIEVYQNKLQMMKEIENNAISDNLQKYETNIYINDVYLYYTQHKAIKSNQLNSIFCNIQFYLSLVFTFLVFLLNLLWREDYDRRKPIVFCGSQRETIKVRKVYGDSKYYLACIRNKFRVNIYQFGSYMERTKLIRKIFSESHKAFFGIKAILEDDLFLTSRIYILRKLAKRIPDTEIAKLMYKNIIKRYEFDDIYTTYMRDRFAYAQEEIAHAYGIKMICIPHGIESIHKLPRVYCGDKFFCSFSILPEFLNNSYNCSKFIYDNILLEKMYSLNVNQKQNSRKVVFFSQLYSFPAADKFSDELIFSIAIWMKETFNLPLYIKPHPTQKKRIYSEIPNTVVIQSFDEVISSNICLSIASTALLEATYNNSVAICCNINSDLIISTNLFADLSIINTNETLNKIVIVDNYQELFANLQHFIQSFGIGSFCR